MVENVSETICADVRMVCTVIIARLGDANDPPPRRHVDTDNECRIKRAAAIKGGLDECAINVSFLIVPMASIKIKSYLFLGDKHKHKKNKRSKVTTTTTTAVGEKRPVRKN